MKASTASYKPVLTKEEGIDVDHGAVAEAVPVSKSSPSRRFVKVLLLTASFLLLVRLLHHCDHDHGRHHEMHVRREVPSDLRIGKEPFFFDKMSPNSIDSVEEEGSSSSDSGSSDSGSSDSGSSDSDSSDSDSSDSDSSDEEQSSDSSSSDEGHPHHAGAWHWLVGGHHKQGHGHHHDEHPRHAGHGHPHHHPGSHDGPGGRPAPRATVREGADFIRAPPMMTESFRGSMIVRPPGVLPPAPLVETVSTERRDETMADTAP
jgi:hypothetical protein